MQRNNVIIHVELHSASRELVHLLADWSSCVRFAYALFREGKSFRSIQFAAKEKYVTLNHRYILPAVKDAHRKHKRTEDQVPIIFGGKELYAKFCAGEISVKEWRFIRDGMMFVRADLTKTGNPGLLVRNTEGGFHLEVFIGNSGFLDKDIRTFPLSVPVSLATRLTGLLTSGAPYNVRIHRKEINKYKGTVDFETND